MIGAYLVARYAYKTDEQTHAKIAAELAERHEKARAEKAASAPQKE
jgi:Na+/melibiose symporter-like transporter